MFGATHSVGQIEEAQALVGDSPGAPTPTR